MTDGHVAIIGHGGQHIALRNGKETEEEKLGQAASIRNNVLLGYKVHQHLGCKYSRITEVNKGQVKEEKVHGGLEI